MKVSSNKSKNKSKTVKTTRDTVSNYQTKPRFSVEPIKNGFLVEKSWTDKDGRYNSEKNYSETNPLDSEESED